MDYLLLHIVNFKTFFICIKNNSSMQMNHKLKKVLPKGCAVKESIFFKIKTIYLSTMNKKNHSENKRFAEPSTQISILPLLISKNT